MIPEKDFPSSHLNRYLRHKTDSERKKVPPIPTNVLSLLNNQQRDSYDMLNLMGWELAFVRRVEIDSPLFVFEHPKTGDFAAIEPNGDITVNPDINIREA